MLGISIIALSFISGFAPDTLFGRTNLNSGAGGKAPHF
jgi:hypothetical protein